jgi:hypothetical protein
MTHLAAGFDLRFAIYMQGRIGFAQLWHTIHIGPNEIFHAYITMAAAIAQGPAGHGADMLLKLANIAAVLGPMT